MAVDEKDIVKTPRGGVATGLGLLKGLVVTMKHLLQPSITQEYPKERPDLPARSRGVIALKQENCTVCYKCSRECPDWCIYIDAHKETHDPAGGGKARSVKVLDRFDIDFSLCMYCGICVEVCPFDALFWSPEFEYAEYDIRDLLHDKEKLETWTYKVLVPPPLEEGAELPAPAAQVVAPVTVPAVAPSGPSDAATGVTVPPVAVQAATEGAADAVAVRPRTEEGGTRAEGAATAPPAATSAAPEGGAPEGAAAATRRKEVALDQETFDRVLTELLEKGTARRVAEGQARRAAMIAARKKAEEG